MCTNDPKVHVAFIYQGPLVLIVYDLTDAGQKIKTNNEKKIYESQE